MYFGIFAIKLIFLRRCINGKKLGISHFYSNVMLFCPLLGIYSCPLCCANYIKSFILLYFKVVTIYPASSCFLLAWLLALTKTFVSLAVALLVCLRSKRNLFREHAL